MVEEHPLPLSVHMRKVTRKIHRSSDALVNLKLAIAFTDRKLYAQAIGLFYSIYKALEEALRTISRDSPLSPMASVIIADLLRTEAFEADLQYHSGPDWKQHLQPTSPALAHYLERLEELKSRDPTLLAPYIYHMYMALLSGGQILKRLATSAMGLKQGEGGTAIFEFDGLSKKSTAAAAGEGGKGGSSGVAEIKATMQQVFDEIEAKILQNDPKRRSPSDLRQALLDESIKVFVSNNQIVGSFDTGHRGKIAWGVLMVLLVFLVVVLILSIRYLATLQGEDR